MKNVLIVYNPASGDASRALLKGQISEFFLTRDVQSHWYTTTGVNDAIQLLKFASEKKPELVIACGGDGTCNLAAGCAIDLKIPLAVIPAGSANALARELEIPLDPVNALNVLENYSIIEIDYMKVNNRLCIRQAEVGVNAQLIRSFEKTKGRGMLQYVLHFFKNMLRWKTFSCRIHSDEGGFKKSHVISLTFASSRKYGTGAMINPTGYIDDGKFEIVVIRSFPWFSLPSVSYKFFRGKIHESVYSDTFSCKEAKVFLRRRKLLQIDGELIGKFSEFNVTIRKQGLKVIIPTGSRI